MKLTAGVLWLHDTQQRMAGESLVCFFFFFFLNKSKKVCTVKGFFFFFPDWGTKADSFLPFISTPEWQSLESVGLPDPKVETDRNPRETAALVGQSE